MSDKQRPGLLLALVGAALTALALRPPKVLVRLYLDRIVKLCRDHGSELLLITVPASSSWNLARHNGIQSFADENGLTYLDYNMADTDPGINWKTDTPDGGSHLNVLGAQKLTAALGTYLTGHYALEDHRGQSGFESWDQDAAAYTQSMTDALAQNQQAADYQLSVLEQTA